MRRARQTGGRKGRAAPSLVWVLGLLGAAFLALPVAGLVARAPWADAGSRLTEAGVADAVRLSLFTATASTMMALVLGVPLAWLLARQDLPAKPLIRAIVLVPLLLPPIVAGIGLLAALGRRGLLGERLDDVFGITLPFSTAGAVVAVAYVALPFVVVTMEGAFRSVDERLERAAETLGASPMVTAATITLPLVLPSLAAGAMLAWARSIGEFGATVTFAGNLPGRTQTVPLATFLALETDLEQAILLSLVMLVPTIVMLTLIRGHEQRMGTP